MTETKIKIITENRKARHDYNIVEAMEAGMELVGRQLCTDYQKRGTGCNEHAHQSLRFWQL